jgi:hypothetical protein
MAKCFWVRYNEWRTNPRPVDPTQGKNGVWCKRGEHEVCIDLVFAEHGYSAVIGEKCDLRAWGEYKLLTSRDE